MLVRRELYQNITDAIDTHTISKPCWLDENTDLTQTGDQTGGVFLNHAG